MRSKEKATPKEMVHPKSSRGLDRSWVIPSLVLVITILGLLGSTPPSVRTVSLPSGIATYLPVTIENSQASSTPAPFQVMLTINSLSLAAFEAPDLHNVEFFYSDGSLIPSWLESGNSNTATRTVYWLKLSNGVPAQTSITIYMGFASQATNLFDGQTIGEASQLSPVYGQYDNGAEIFGLYDNFVGTTLSSQWSNFGSNGIQGSLSQITVNNGLVLTPTLGALYYQGTWVGATSSLRAQLTESLAADAYIAAAQPVTNFARSACQIGCFETRFGFEDVFPSNLAEGNGTGFDIASSSVVAVSNDQYTVVNVGLPTTTLNQFNVYSVDYRTNSVGFQVNYVDVSGPVTTNVPSPSSQMGLFLETNYQQISSLVGWIRTRASPPNGIMPRATVQVKATGLTPTVDNADVLEQATSIQLPVGSQLYIYGFATGGCCPTGDFQYGQYASVDDVAGFRIGALAVTSSNMNSYPSQTSYNTIGSVAISGFSSYTPSYQLVTATGPDLSVSVTFSVATSNSLAVVFAIGGGAQCQELSGVPNLGVDADTQLLNPILTIAHSYLGPGRYTVTANSHQCAAGQDPNHAGALLAVFVFSGFPQQGAPSLHSISSVTTIEGHAPLTVSFTGSATGGTAPYAFSWKFGDGFSSNLQNATHTYNSTGVYNAILNVTDGSSSTSASIIQVTVTASDPSNTANIPSPLFQWWLWAILGLSLLSTVLVVSKLRPKSLGKGVAPGPKNNLLVCLQCGGQMPPASSFCGKCGYRFQASK